MPRQGRIKSGTGVYHVMMRGINRQRIFEDSEDHYTFLQCLRSAQEKFTPLGDRLPNSRHYYAYVEAPFENNVSSIEYEDERDRAMSDNCVMLCLKVEFGITDRQQIQKLSKNERDVILAALLRRHAGVRQLQRLTGIGKNIISNVSKTL